MSTLTHRRRTVATYVEIGTPVKATKGENVLVGTVRGRPTNVMHAFYDIEIPGAGLFRIRLADGWTVEPNITVPTKPWAIVANSNNHYFYVRRPDGVWNSSGAGEYDDEYIRKALSNGNFTIVSEGIN